MTFNVLCLPFYALTPDQMYDMLRLRSEVFVVEQNCVFLDMDNKDKKCHHLLFYTSEGELVACARLVPPGLSYPETSIGRIVTGPTVRGTGAGKQLVEEAINQCYKLYGKGPIKIGAQLYAKGFYEMFGFVQTSEVYDEDGIDHILMVKA
ncbi:GNAT family N-acetyltransferase [Pontibacter vulgaris]|uniref:GNAT family N-acetyltransferase n=1 Tax=Pontibacter vulgaris TaxID=2905679 RepID=UPI001FA7B2A6|nr:GNAT family N-acetyltransferase [Pontibacter vulgaris]